MLQVFWCSCSHHGTQQVWFDSLDCMLVPYGLVSSNSICGLDHVYGISLSFLILGDAMGIFLFWFRY